MSFFHEYFNVGDSTTMQLVLSAASTALDGNPILPNYVLYYTPYNYSSNRYVSCVDESVLCSEKLLMVPAPGLHRCRSPGKQKLRLHWPYLAKLSSARRVSGIGNETVGVESTVPRPDVEKTVQCQCG